MPYLSKLIVDSIDKFIKIHSLTGEQDIGKDERLALRIQQIVPNYNCVICKELITFYNYANRHGRLARSNYDHYRKHHNNELNNIEPAFWHFYYKYKLKSYFPAC